MNDGDIVHVKNKLRVLNTKNKFYKFKGIPEIMHTAPIFNNKLIKNKMPVPNKNKVNHK